MKPLAQNSMIQNRYLVVQMIGKGGMGEVYLAVDQRLGSAVALKRTMFKENEGLATAFEREAKILGRLRHPVLPKVIDHFAEGPDQYLVMEHISGEDMGKRLETAGKPFPLSWVMFWSDQLLDALNYLHSHEPPIIHRDIKPENLKLTDDNHIVLLDFGLSKDFDSRSDTNSLGTGSVVGYSPYFASMEQVRGTGTDARSDIYSFSATIYQLLTNTMPADSLTRADAMLGGAPDPVQAISSINPEVSPAVSDVILKGLAVRQENRYATAAEMQKELRRAFNRGADAPSETMAESTLPSAGEAKTQIIPNVATLIPDQTDAARRLPPETAIMPDQTAIMPDPTVEVANASTDAVKQADIRTQVMATPVIANADDLEPEQVTMPRMAIGAAAGAANSQPPVQKKKSKAGLVIGGLLGLLVLGGIAAGGGWFAYTNYYLPSQVAASPTPTVEPLISPSPEPSPTLMANTNSDDSNTEFTEANTNTAAPANRITPIEIRPTTGPVAKNPAKTPQTPGVKPTPKPKGRDDRTVILQ
jgi:hypothetical protein